MTTTASTGGQAKGDGDDASLWAQGICPCPCSKIRRDAGELAVKYIGAGLSQLGGASQKQMFATKKVETNTAASPLCFW